MKTHSKNNQTCLKRGKTQATKTCLVLVLHLIGWVARVLISGQSQFEVKQNQWNLWLLSTFSWKFVYWGTWPGERLARVWWALIEQREAILVQSRITINIRLKIAFSPMHWILSWKFHFSRSKPLVTIQKCGLQCLQSLPKMEIPDWITWRPCYQPTGARPFPRSALAWRSME